MEATGGGFARLSALYRSVLRVHREVLPGPLRALGDGYAADEFRRHVAKANSMTQQQWSEFGARWAEYVSMLRGRADLEQQPASLGDSSGALPQDVAAALSPAQQAQLSKLRAAAQELARGNTTRGDNAGSLGDTSPMG